VLELTLQTALETPPMVLPSLTARGAFIFIGPAPAAQTLLELFNQTLLSTPIIPLPPKSNMLKLLMLSLLGPTTIPQPTLTPFLLSPSSRQVTLNSTSKLATRSQSGLPKVLLQHQTMSKTLTSNSLAPPLSPLPPASSLPPSSSELDLNFRVYLTLPAFPLLAF
jgi:hypothetical protein